MGSYTAEVEDPTTGEITVLTADTLVELEELVQAHEAREDPERGE